MAAMSGMFLAGNGVFSGIALATILARFRAQLDLAEPAYGGSALAAAAGSAPQGSKPG